MPNSVDDEPTTWSDMLSEEKKNALFAMYNGFDIQEYYTGKWVIDNIQEYYPGKWVNIDPYQMYLEDGEDRCYRIDPKDNI